MHCKNSFNCLGPKPESGFDGLVKGLIPFGSSWSPVDLLGTLWIPLDPPRSLLHTGIFAKNSFQIDSMNSCSISKQLLFGLKIVKIIHFLTLKPIKGNYYSTSRDDLGVKRSSMIHLSSFIWFRPLFSSQN